MYFDRFLATPASNLEYYGIVKVPRERYSLKWLFAIAKSDNIQIEYYPIEMSWLLAIRVIPPYQIYYK